MYCYYYDEFIKKFQLDPNSIEPLYDFVKRSHSKITPHIQFHLDYMKPKKKLNLQIICGCKACYVIKNRSKNKTVLETWAHLVAKNIFSMTPAKHYIVKNDFGNSNIVGEYIQPQPNFSRLIYPHNNASKINMIFQFLCCFDLFNFTNTIPPAQKDGGIIFRNIDLGNFGKGFPLKKLNILKKLKITIQDILDLNLTERSLLEEFNKLDLSRIGETIDQELIDRTTSSIMDNYKTLIKLLS